MKEFEGRMQNMLFLWYNDFCLFQKKLVEDYLIMTKI